MILACVGLVLPVVAAWLALRATGVRRPNESALVTWALACGLGLGVASVGAFVALTLGGSMSRWYAAADAVAWGAVAVAAWRKGRWPSGRRASATEAPPRPAGLRAARALFVMVALLSAAGPVLEYLASPHGQWDAWAIWNQKARFMFRAGQGWTASLDVPWSAPSHPMFVSLSVVRLWAYAGGEPTVVPAVLSGVYGAAIVALVMGALDVSRARAWVAGAALVAPFAFTHLVAAQTADLPLGLFVTASLVVLRTGDPSFWSNRVDTTRALLLAGVLGGLAAWTKNEGFVFLAASGMLVAWVTLRYGRFLDARWWLLGALPAVALVLWFKVAIAPSPPAYLDESAQGGATIVQRLLSTERHETVQRLMAPLAMAWGGPMSRGLLPVSLLTALVVSVRSSGRSGRGLMAVVAMMLASYYAVWVVSSIDTEFLVNTTLDRLVMQMWPLVVLVAFSGSDRA